MRARMHKNGQGRGRGGGPGARSAGRGWDGWRERPRREVRGLYRSRRGIFLGVCQGVANYFDISVFWLRFFTVLTVLFTGLWPGVFLYFLAALVMRMEPVVPVNSPTEREFYDSYSRSRSLALHRLKEQFDRLERRLRRAEDYVTSSDYQWERRMREK
ncbi:envelope stress response membrane protein PspC [Desulfobaculum sp. SPO524]|uniref:envelope stress response membrane protein PspC n=1 Tax=Desulfobaculum sp. SPO524 TaxID=3378071 RepID=UPI003851B6B4